MNNTAAMENAVRRRHGAWPALDQPSLLLHCLLLVSAADRFAIQAGGVSIKLAWLALPILYLLAKKGRQPSAPLLFASVFFLAHLSASLFAENKLLAFAYSLQIPAFYWLFFKTAFDLCQSLDRAQVFRVVLLSGRAQILLAALLVLLGIDERATFLYYEPSYMAIALIPYVFVSIFHSKRRFLDLLFLLLFLGTAASANFILILLAALLFVGLYAGGIAKTVKFFLMAMVILACSLPLLRHVGDGNPNAEIARTIADDMDWDLLVAVAYARAGNRFPRLEMGFDAALDKPLLGLGPGNYTRYSESLDSEAYGSEWMSPAGLPVVNIELDLILNGGIASLLIAAWFFLHLFRRCKRIPEPAAKAVALGTLAVIALVMQFESTYMRPYLWVYFGMFYALSSLRGAAAASGMKRHAS